MFTYLKQIKVFSIDTYLKYERNGEHGNNINA